MDSDEKTVLQQIEELKKVGIIRRISALINYRALGMASTLAAAHVPEESLQEVAEAVNSLENVSHNYRRHHYYNLWFTLQAQSNQEIEVMLSNLSGRFGIDFYNLSVKRVFKLDVRFDAESEEDNTGGLLQDVAQVPVCEKVELDENQKRILSGLQGEVRLTSEPFDFLCGEGLEREDVLRIIAELIDKGVIRRIAAVVDHHKLGFVANVLFASEVSQDRIIEAGEKLARFGMVSHCYERKTFENWPYNLFAMMHARSMGEIQHVINRYTEAEKIDSFQLLPTAAEFKKQPVKHRSRLKTLDTRLKTQDSRVIQPARHEEKLIADFAPLEERELRF
jgi:DNA-binding Lrp family transcriptional regulator